MPTEAPWAEARVRVRYAETDQMGVVYHANYLVWMEVGRVEYWRQSGLSYRDLERDEGILLVVAEANCRYRTPAFYDDEVVIRTRVAESNSRYVRFEYELAVEKEAEGETAGDSSEPERRIVATGYTKHVFCGPDRRPRRLPEKYHASLGI